jgi:hypothetical protein
VASPNDHEERRRNTDSQERRHNLHPQEGPHNRLLIVPLRTHPRAVHRTPHQADLHIRLR